MEIMKNVLHFTKRLIQNLIGATVMILIAFAFLAFCNWSLSIGEWNGFSKFLMAIVMLVISIATWDAMTATVKNFNKPNVRKSERLV